MEKIRTLEKMMAFAGGIGVGVMFKKYERQISSYMKKQVKKMNK